MLPCRNARKNAPKSGEISKNHVKSHKKGHSKHSTLNNVRSEARGGGFRVLWFSISDWAGALKGSAIPGLEHASWQLHLRCPGGVTTPQPDHSRAASVFKAPAGNFP